jgi:hypothetical protein
MAATFTKLPSGVVKATIDGRILYLKPQMSNASIYDATRIRLELQTFAPKEDLFFILDTSEVTLPAGPWASAEALCDELNTNYFFSTAGGGAPSSELVANSLTLDPAAAPAPTALQVALAQVDVGRRMLGIVAGNQPPYPLQPFMATSRVAIVQGVATSNSFSLQGILGTPITAGFVPTPRAIAMTNALTRMRRTGLVSLATAGSVGQFRVSTAMTTTGDGAGLGGFFFALRFAITDAAAVATARMFLGVREVVTPTNVSPATLTNAIGVGHDAGESTLSLYHGDASAAAPIVLPAAFSTAAGIPYDLVLYAPSKAANTCYYKVTRIDTGDVAAGVLTTGLPLATTVLAPWVYRTNNATALSVALDIMQLYTETDF